MYTGVKNFIYFYEFERSIKMSKNIQYVQLRLHVLLYNTFLSVPVFQKFVFKMDTEF